MMGTVESGYAGLFFLANLEARFLGLNNAFISIIDTFGRLSIDINIDQFIFTFQFNSHTPCCLTNADRKILACEENSVLFLGVLGRCC